LANMRWKSHCSTANHGESWPIVCMVYPAADARILRVYTEFVFEVLLLKPARPFTGTFASPETQILCTVLKQCSSM
jgi:hypothetical protein